MNPEIRRACLEDWEQIAQFNQLLALETEKKELDWETLAAGVKSVLNNEENGRYFVACLDGQLIGQVMHTREWSDWRNGEIWWLQSVYVDAEFRKQGVFRTLYQTVLNEAKENEKVVGIRLYVENENHRAHQTYQKLGMSHSGYQVLEEMF